VTGYKKKLFFVPGVAQITEDIKKGMYKGDIFHRSDNFKIVYNSVQEKLKNIFKTKNRIFLVTSSGTGSMETCICNFVNKGDNILVVDGGKYGRRWSEILNAYSIKHLRLEIEWGKSLDIPALKDYLQTLSGLDMVFLTHCETSTGAHFDLEPIVKTIKNYFNCLVVVDAISTLGAVEFESDNWGIDVTVGCSQKGLLAPPGLALLTANSNAMKKSERSTLPKYYFDLKKYAGEDSLSQTPFTPGSLQFRLLDNSLNFITKYGIDSIHDAVQNFSHVFRETLSSFGYSFFPETPSPVISVIKTRKDPLEFIKILSEKHNVVIAKGHNKIKNKVVRVSHIGLYSEGEIEYLIALFKNYKYLLL